MKFVKIISLLVVLSTILCLFPATTTYADEVRFGVSPSFFNGVKVEPGKSVEVKFKVSNTTVYPKSETQKDQLYTFTISLKGADIYNKKQDISKLSDEERLLVDPSMWVTFDKNNFLLKPGEMQEIRATIKVPEKADMGEHSLSLEVTRNPIDGVDGGKNGTNVNTQVTSTIDIPVFVNVYNPATNSDGLIEKAEIKNFDITDKMTTKTLWDIVSGLLTFNSGWSDRVDELFHQPIKISFGSGDSQHIYYDMVKPKIVPLREVTTYDSKKLDDKKYILLPNGLTDKSSIDRMDFTDKEIKVISDGKDYSIGVPNQSISNMLKDEVSNLSYSSTSKPTLGQLLDDLKVNSNLKYSDINLYASYDIKNIGTKTIVPTGSLDVFDENNKKIDSASYQYTIIMPNIEKKIMATLKYDPVKLDSGTYTVRSTIIPYTNAKPETRKIQITITNIRTWIIVGFIVAFLILIALIIIIIRIIIKLVRKHKKKKQNPTQENKAQDTQIQNDDSTKD